MHGAKTLVAILMKRLELPPSLYPASKDFSVSSTGTSDARLQEYVDPTNQLILFDF